MRESGFLQEERAVQELRGMVGDLLYWYRGNKRGMRWRDDPSPYFVWVAEIMLQQTRIEAVKGYFDRFVKEVPDIRTLATTDEDKLLKLWEGLGYYNRVRNMKKAAVCILERHGGTMPSDYASLQSLPGIGSYTAGAVASIAYGVKAPTVDGNVLRVLMRTLACRADVTRASTKKAMERLLMNVIPEEAPGDFNQGLMELGEVVCIPNGRPLCGNCPLNAHCLARRDDVAEKLPVKADKKARRKEERTVFLFECAGRYAIRKRMDKGLLAGMWELPNQEGILSESELKESLGAHADCTVTRMGEAKHVFSHVEWNMLGYLVRMRDGRTIKDGVLAKDLVWEEAKVIRERYALPTAFHYYKRFIGDENGGCVEESKGKV